MPYLLDERTIEQIRWMHQWIKSFNVTGHARFSNGPTGPSLYVLPPPKIPPVPVPTPLVQMQIVEWMLPAAGTPGSGGANGFPTVFIAKCTPTAGGGTVYVQTAQDHYYTPGLNNGDLFWATRPQGPLGSVQIDNATPPTIVTAKWLEVPVRVPLRWGTLVSDWLPGNDTVELTPATGHANIFASLANPDHSVDPPQWCGWSAGDAVPYVQTRSNGFVGGQFLVYDNPLPRTTSIGHVLQNTLGGNNPWLQMQAFTLY